MALPRNRPTNLVATAAYMADSGTASSVYMTAPVRGQIKSFKSVLQGTVVGTANNAFTAFKGSSAITIDAWLQLTSGSAAGDVVTVNCASPTGFVNEGDTIRVTTDGAGSNVTPTMVYAIIEAH